MNFLILFSLFSIVLLWQDLAFILLLSFFIFYAIYRENFIFLKARKLVIKRASLQKNSLFFKLSRGAFFIKILAFFASFCLCLSLLLNLLYANRLDLFFYFIIFPSVFFLLRLLLNSQFKKSSYNIPYFIVLAAIPSAFLYALMNLFLLSDIDAFEYLQNNIDAYKMSSLPLLDIFSQGINIMLVLKNFIALYFDSFGVHFLLFIFDVLNFCLSAIALGFVYTFSLQNKKYLFFIICLGILLVFVYDEKRNTQVKYQDKIPNLVENMQNMVFLDENLSHLQENIEENTHFLRVFKQILEKSAFDIGFWWFSDEKKELLDELKKVLDEV